MQIITKDLLTVEDGIICHQVNCQRIMGSGLAKQIKDKWPFVNKGYESYCDMYKGQEFTMLGKVLYVRNIPNAPDLVVANIFGQLDYGKEQRHTDYAALNEAFHNIEDHPIHWEQKKKVYFPYLFGCDRGGGDWKIVSRMIEYYLPNAIICRLPKKP